MAISINFTKTVDNAVDPSQKKTYINGAFTSAEDIANFPTAGIAVGSELVNVGGGNDTGKKYVFSGTEWNLAPSGGGLPTPSEGSEGCFLCVSPQGEWFPMGTINVDRTYMYDFIVNDYGELSLDSEPSTISTSSVRKIMDGELVFCCRIMLIEGVVFYCIANVISIVNDHVFLELRYPNLDLNLSRAIISFENDDLPNIQNFGDFIITATPTAQNYSGTMDRSPQEITNAIKAGRRIIFSIPSMSAKVVCDQFQADNGNTVAAAKIWYISNGVPLLISVLTSTQIDEPTPGSFDYYYNTSIYQLTPVS